MNYSEIANIAVSIVSVGIALVALFQTKRQIALSNKQQLLDRRLSCFLEFNTIYNLYVANKLYLKDDSRLSNSCCLLLKAICRFV